MFLRLFLGNLYTNPCVYVGLVVEQYRVDMRILYKHRDVQLSQPVEGNADKPQAVGREQAASKAQANTGRKRAKQKTPKHN
jgi:hypothetical protein